MKKLFRNLIPCLASLLAMCSFSPLYAQTEDFAGKVISLGGNATTLEAGQWYVLYNGSTSSYVVEGSNNTLGVSTTSPNGANATSNAGYLIQLEATETEGRYYLKTGLGNYIANVTTSKNNGTSATLVSKYFYTITQLASAGHWSLRSNNLYYLQNSNGKLIGSSSAGSAGSDRDWVFRQVTLADISDLTGTAYVRYVLSTTNLVRLTNRRYPSNRLVDNGTNTAGASANNNTLAQVWILAKSGDGYILRNADTGRFLNDNDNFRSPSATSNTVHIQFSPNNGTNDAYINISEDSGFSGNVCLNLNGTTLYKWTCQNDTGSDWSIALAENFTM